MDADSFAYLCINNLTSKSPTIRYHSQYCLRRLQKDSPHTVISSFISFLDKESILNKRHVDEIAYFVAYLSNCEGDFKKEIIMLAECVESAANKTAEFNCTTELSSFASSLFKIIPDLLETPPKGILSLASLALSASPTHKVPPDSILEMECNSWFSKLSRARLIAAICNTCDLEPLRHCASQVLADFLANPSGSISVYLPSIIAKFPPSEEEKQAVLAAVLGPPLIKEMISSIPTLIKSELAESLQILRELIPALSILPFQFTLSLPNESDVAGFSEAVQATAAMINSETSAGVTKFLIENAMNENEERRTGVFHAMTCLLNQGCRLDNTAIVNALGFVHTPADAGVSSELLVAMKNNGGLDIDAFTYLEMIEKFFDVSDDLSRPFVLDASSLLHTLTNANTEAFQAALGKHIVSYPNRHVLYKNAIRDFEAGPGLVVAKCILGESVSLSPSIHAEPAKTLLMATNDVAIRRKLIRLLTQLMKTASRQTTASIAHSIITVLTLDLHHYVDEASDFISTYFVVDSRSSITCLRQLIQTQVKSWFIFGSSAPSRTSIAVVFGSLKKLESGVEEFLQVVADYIPNPEDAELATLALDSLASVLMSINKSDSETGLDVQKAKMWEFPPKCRYFDFAVAASSFFLTPSLLRVLAVLIVVPPTSPVSHIPLAMNLIMKAGDCPEATLLLTSTLAITESLSEVKLIIEPLLKQLSAPFPSSLLAKTLNYLTISDQPADDSIMLMLAEVIGTTLPLFDKLHLLVREALALHCHFTKRALPNPYGSLQETVRQIAISFDTSSIRTIALFLCRNQTLASVTSYVTLFSERETELMETLRTFLEGICVEHAGMLFDANETLARASTAMLTSDCDSLIRDAAKSSKYKEAVIDEVLAQFLNRRELVVHLAEDGIIDLNRPEAIISAVLKGSDLVNRAKIEKSSEIIEMVSKIINNLSLPEQVQIASFISSFGGEAAVNSFGNLVYTKEIAYVFGNNKGTIEGLLKVIKNDSALLREIVPITLKIEGSLEGLTPVLARVLFFLLRDPAAIDNICMQKSLDILIPYVPVIVASAYSRKRDLSEKICSLLSKLSPITTTYVSSFVSLLELCEEIDMSNASRECLGALDVKSRSTTTQTALSSMVVLSYLSRQGILTKEHTESVRTLVESLAKEQKEQVVSAVMISLCNLG